MRDSPTFAHPHVHSPTSGQRVFDPYSEWLGIAPDERAIDHYRLLGLPAFESNPATIAAAADERMALVRKQQTGPRGAHTQVLLNELSSARLCLLDPAAKAAYDASLQQRQSAAPAIQSAATEFPVNPPRAAADEVNDESPDVAARPARPLLTMALAAMSVVAIAALVWAGSLIVLPRAPVVLPQDSSSPSHLAIEVDPRMAAQSPAVDDPLDASAAVLMNQEATGEIHLPAQTALVHGQSVRCETHDGGSFIVDWSNENDSLAWRFNVIRPGVFRVELTYAAPPESAGGRYLLSIGEQKKRADVRSGEAADELLTDYYFMAVRRAGENTLVIRPLEIQGGELMRLKALRLIPQYSIGG